MTKYLLLLLMVLAACNTTRASENTQPTIATANCQFTTTLENVRVFSAPITDPGYETEMLSPDTNYPVVGRTETHFRLALADSAWVDRRSGSVAGECDAIPVDATPIFDYPSICTLTTPDVAMDAFSDPTLTQASPFGANLPANTQFVVSILLRDAVNVHLGDAASVWVGVNAGELSGQCNLTEAAATALANARLWSQPNTVNGEIVADVPADTDVIILGGSLTGAINSDGTEGDWYHVFTTDGQSGWIWEGRLNFND